MVITEQVLTRDIHRVLLAVIGVSAERFCLFPAMESFGSLAPPPLEDYDDFQRSLQLCPVKLLKFVEHGLMRYVEGIQAGGRLKGLDEAKIEQLCQPYWKRSVEVSDFEQRLRGSVKTQVTSRQSLRLVAVGAREVDTSDSVDGVSSRGGFQDSSGGGAAVPSSTSSELQAAEIADTAEFLGRPRRKRLNRKKLKFVKAGAKVVVRRWADGAEFGPFHVETAGHYFLRVRNPVSGQKGRVCRKKFGTFDWRPPRVSRSFYLESGEGSRSQWSSSSLRKGAWSCPSPRWSSEESVPFRPYCCRSVCDARFDPGPWFGPMNGRCGAPNRHTSRFCRSS